MLSARTQTMCCQHQRLGVRENLVGRLCVRSPAVRKLRDPGRPQRWSASSPCVRATQQTTEPQKSPSSAPSFDTSSPAPPPPPPPPPPQIDESVFGFNRRTLLAGLGIAGVAVGFNVAKDFLDYDEYEDEEALLEALGNDGEVTPEKLQVLEQLGYGQRAPSNMPEMLPESKAFRDGTKVTYAPVASIYEQNALRPERDWPKADQSQNPLEEFIFYKDLPYAKLKKGGWMKMSAFLEDAYDQFGFVMEARSGAQYTLRVPPKIKPNDQAFMNAFMADLKLWEARLCPIGNPKESKKPESLDSTKAPSKPESQPKTVAK